jgi:hypothetical protein
MAASAVRPMSSSSSSEITSRPRTMPKNKFFRAQRVIHKRDFTDWCVLLGRRRKSETTVTTDCWILSGCYRKTDSYVLANVVRNPIHRSRVISHGKEEGSTDTPGAKTTLEACERLHKPEMLVTSNAVVLASDVVAWLRRNPQIKRLNIAGNRESKNPGIGERVERFLMVVFKRAKERAHS